MDESDERVALIAGGSGGIGRAVSRTLGSAGIAVYVGAGRNPRAAESIIEEISRSGGRARAVHLDVCDAAMIERVCEGIFEREGRLGVILDGDDREAVLAEAMEHATGYRRLFLIQAGFNVKELMFTPEIHQEARLEEGEFRPEVTS